MTASFKEILHQGFNSAVKGKVCDLPTTCDFIRFKEGVMPVFAADIQDLLPDNVDAVLDDDKGLTITFDLAANASVEILCHHYDRNDPAFLVHVSTSEETKSSYVLTARRLGNYIGGVLFPDSLPS